jgi:protein phosphatase
MGTTCTVAAIKSSQLYLAHIGDSRAYLFRDGDLHQLTTDHTWVEEAVVSGILTRDAARVHPNRSVITRAVGLDPEVEADKQMMPLMAGDLLLLCSDGLNSMVTDADITDLLSSNVPEQVCAALIDVARGAGGHDNVTVVVAAS